MPMISSLVCEATKQIIEPVSEQITKRLLQTLGCLSTFEDRIFVTSDDLQSSNFDDPEHKKRVPDNRCDVAIMPGYNPLQPAFESFHSRDLDIFLSSRRGIYSDYPIFNDPRSEISVFEIAVPTSIELQFSIKVKSIELSDMINMALYSRYLTGGSVYDYNDIAFSYGVPDAFIVLMYRMFKMQDDLVAKGITFPEYLATFSGDGITTLINRDRLEDGDKEIIFLRNNSKVLGKLDYAGDKHDTEDFNKVSNRYVISFNYTYQFSKPAILKMSYPVMVYNKLIDQQWIGTTVNMNYGEGPQMYPDRATNLYFYKKNSANIDLTRSYPLVRYPFFDDWQRSNAMYKDVNAKYQPLFIGLLTITQNEDTGALELGIDIKNEVFPLFNTAVISAFDAFITDPVFKQTVNTADKLFRRMGIFDIAIFKNDTLTQFENLQLDDNLVLTVNSTLDLSKQYRIVISQIRDLRILNREYIFYMLENPAYYEDLLAAHMTYLEVNGFIKIIYDPFKDPTVSITKFGIGDLQKRCTPNSIIINNFIIEIHRTRMT